MPRHDPILARGPVLAGLVLAAMLPGGTAAAAVPTAVASPRALEVTPVSLAFDGAGRLMASWRGLEGTPDATRGFHAAALRSGSTWDAAVRLPRTIVTHDTAITGGRTIGVAAWRQEAVSRGRSRSVITVSLSDSAALRLRATSRLDAGPALRVTFEGAQPTLASPRIAATPKGFVAAWVRTAPRERAGVWVATMGASGAFGHARRLGPAGSDPVLAVAPDGTGVLVWRRGHLTLSRPRLHSGAWGPIERVTATAPRQWAAVESLTAAAANGGRAAVGVLQTARSGAGVWSRSSAHLRGSGPGWTSGTLGEFTFNATGSTTYVTDRLRVLVVAGRDGRLHAAWPALDGGRARAFTTVLVPDAVSVGFGLPVALSPEGADVALEDAAAGPGGSLAVTWFDTSAGGGTPNLAEVDAGGTVHRTLALAGERALLGSQVAYDPRTGRPSAAWSEGNAAQGYHLVAWTGPAR